MARTVDPARYEARRLVIIDAALTSFAAEGYAGTTTAAICRRAGIGSGTFFHYFPTKLDVLLAILDLGTDESAQWFRAQQGRTDARAVIADFVNHTADDLADPRLPGFVRAVGAVMTTPAVAAALRRDEDTQHQGLLPWIAAARECGDARDDVTAEQLCTWVHAIIDGFVGRAAGERPFDATSERGMLLDTVDRLLRP